MVRGKKVPLSELSCIVKRTARAKDIGQTDGSIYGLITCQKCNKDRWVRLSWIKSGMERGIYTGLCHDCTKPPPPPTIELDGDLIKRLYCHQYYTQTQLSRLFFNSSTNFLGNVDAMVFKK
ncbi:unnamed protein product [marine sediment metagenome]|uniref:Uncharacterized protein n=1 Tax=marine sediment metagenome TaxID=412755 RepID=X0Z3A5_9ZZZZ